MFSTSGFLKILSVILFFLVIIAAMFFVHLLSKEKENIVTENMGIKKVWLNRNKALKEIEEKIFLSEKEIFISGITLATTFGLLRTPDFVERMASNISSDKNLGLLLSQCCPNQKRYLRQKIKIGVLHVANLYEGFGILEKSFLIAFVMIQI